ncbi:hypothetical protein [Aliikangiella coralliicola]|uniref:Uncharacterized protein n=1 Tax=Aliikangiella coralliicola TaxID=2592383 RepID=A0A545UIC1_9GAMM|nr:hypothetical protein [Aliikangiella coralliicola]TQV89214.1 hypothetical protein FLL46_03545 [Aliikangiella coralliicola]
MESEAEAKAAENTDNPYQSPQSQIGVEFEPETYQGSIYNILSIAVATLFGSVLAAGLLLQSNFEKFGQKRQAIVTLFLTIIATIGLLFASLFIDYPSSLLYLLINFLAAVIVLPLTGFLQGKSIDDHEYSDRPFHSIFRAIGIGLVCMIGLGVMLMTALMLYLNFAQPY